MYYSTPTDAFIKSDVMDAADPQSVAEYAKECQSHMEATQLTFQPKTNSLALQVEINRKMRNILVGWLIDVHLKFKLLPETLYLTVNLLDRYCELKQVTKANYQLVGVTAMMIASKYEEIYAPEVRDYVYITDKAYTREEVLAQEFDML